MAKNQPVTVGSILSMPDITAWFNDNPILPSSAETYFPKVENMKSKQWQTISNTNQPLNEAADHISLNSPVPIAGREGFQSVLGEMTSFGKARDWDADKIEQFNELKIRFAELNNQTNAQRLVDFYGNDLSFLRNSMSAQMAYMDWALISNACSYSFLRANSPYLVGITAMDYPVSAWQKTAVGTSWSNTAADILGDIQTTLDAGEDKGKYYQYIFINKTTARWVRANDAIKANTITLVGSLVGADNNPTMEMVNSMLSAYFDTDIQFVVVNEKVTRESLDGVKTTANPFADGVAVFSQTAQLGHFEWNGIPIIDPSKETFEDFFIVGNKLEVDPSYSKTYVKGRGFPVVDTYADNSYVKVNAVAW